jgi:hypothetical protein
MYIDDPGEFAQADAGPTNAASCSALCRKYANPVLQLDERTNGKSLIRQHPSHTQIFAVAGTAPNLHNRGFPLRRFGAEPVEPEGRVRPRGRRPG